MTPRSGGTAICQRVKHENIIYKRVHRCVKNTRQESPVPDFLLSLAVSAAFAFPDILLSGSTAFAFLSGSTNDGEKKRKTGSAFWLSFFSGEVSARECPSRAMCAIAELAPRSEGIARSCRCLPPVAPATSSKV